MSLSWSFRRKVLYLAAVAVIAAGMLFALYELFFTAAPTCRDGTQNQNEAGVDCGGVCSLLCADTARAPQVLWARAFQTDTPSIGSGQAGVYTAAAYVQNQNGAAGARSVRYSFQLFDANNSLVIERDGVVDLPPVQTIPIVEQNINVGTRSVARALFAFSEVPAWERVSAGSIPVLRMSGQNLLPDGSRLSETVSNDSQTDVTNVSIVAVLFDTHGIARAASKSILASLPSGSAQEVVFTWPAGVPNVVRAEITTLPSF
ncbi:MAG: hypothetical protein Q7S26_04430 [bacterium]|nr:hypothetical protein [bacterium]